MPGTDRSAPLTDSDWIAPSSAALRRALLATDLAELARQYSTLEPTGVDCVLRGNCPLRPDDTPLFFVSHAETFHCLGCGARGNALEFLMQVDGIGPVHALHKLEKLIEGRQADYQGGGNDPETLNALVQVHAQAAKFYVNQLNGSPDAIAYLNKREITEETAAFWMLGYSPESWHTIQDALNEHPVELLVRAGLLVQKGVGRPYDRFRGRLMFPIRGPSGDMIAFGGRTLGQGEPKYLNSPETASFRKGRTLYGQYESRYEDASVDRLWVVEGYMDVITLWQQGIRNCTATLGTTTSTDQITRLFQATTDLLYCFDGDDAGRHAAWRALERTLPALRRGQRVHFLMLPEGEDPDTLARKGRLQAVEALADAALSLPIFLSRELSAMYDTSHADGRVLYLERAAQLLRLVTDQDWRSDLATELAERARVSSNTIERLADEPRPMTRRSRPRRPRFRQVSPAAKLPQRWLKELVDRIDIAEVIGGYVKLLRAGKEYRACCPFHSEKTPSFTVNVEKRFWHCFGCGKHGNVIDFLTQHGRIGFRDAVTDLARRAGMRVPLPSRSKNDRQREHKVISACQRLLEFFRSQLASQPGRLHSLGIDERLAREFHVGYAPPVYAMPAESMEALRDAGLVNEHGQPRITDRLVMPITTTRGDMIGLVAPGPLNATEELPIVCGLPSAQEQLIQHPARSRESRRELFVAPSPLDLLPLTAIGLSAVAIPKLYPMSAHFALLSRLADNIVLCLPSGTRGDQLTVCAAHEYADALKPGVASTRVLDFPPEKPFALLVREMGAAALEQKARDAKPLLHTALRVLPQLLNKKSPRDRKRYLGHMSRFAGAPSQAAGIVTLESLRQSWDIPASEVDRAIRRTGLDPAEIDDRLSLRSPVLRLVSALLRDPSCVRYLEHVPRSEDPNIGLVQELIAYLRSISADATPDVGAFIDQHPKRTLLMQLVAQPLSVEPIVHLVESIDALDMKTTRWRLPTATLPVSQRAGPSRELSGRP